MDIRIDNMVEIIVACITSGTTLIGGFFLIVRYLNKQNAKLVENVRIDSLAREKALFEMLDARTETIEKGREEMTMAYRANADALSGFKTLLQTIATRMK